MPEQNSPCIKDREAIRTQKSKYLSVTPKVTEIYQRVKGKTPVQHIREIRLEKTGLLLKTTMKSVSEIAYEAGFSDPVIFQRNLIKYSGLTPGQYRDKKSD